MYTYIVNIHTYLKCNKPIKKNRRFTNQTPSPYNQRASRVRRAKRSTRPSFPSKRAQRSTSKFAHAKSHDNRPEARIKITAKPFLSSGAMLRDVVQWTDRDDKGAKDRSVSFTFTPFAKSTKAGRCMGLCCVLLQFEGRKFCWQGRGDCLEPEKLTI